MKALKILLTCLLLVSVLATFIACMPTPTPTPTPTPGGGTGDNTSDNSGNNSGDNGGGNSVHTHTEGSWIVDSDPTCTKAGSKHTECTGCGETMSTATIPATDNHREGSWIIDSTPSCGATGSKHTECTECGTTVSTATIPATGSHREGNWIVDQQATCTASGSKHTECTVCGRTISTSTTSSLGHQYGEGQIIKAASCTQDGTKKYTCTRPGCYYSYTESFSLPTYSATEIYNQSVRYVGEITVYDRYGNESSLGTGFVLSTDGKVITNYHVIEDAYSAKITINGVTYSISYILAYDKTIDLAILKVNATGLVAAPICTNPVQVGETVYAIGSSRGLTNTYSQGIVTYANRVVYGVSHVQHDASITHGNSGGPLINVYGEVIGINTWGISDSQNLNFAVSTSEIDNLVYGTRLTLAQFYDMNHSASDLLLEWLANNYIDASDGVYRYDYYTDGGVLYSIAYDAEDDRLFIDSYWRFDNGAILYLVLNLPDNSSSYEYYAHYEYEGYENYTYGYLYPASFTENTTLTYYSYSGRYWDEATLMEFYSVAMVDMISWFDWCLGYNDAGLGIVDFGFTAL